MAINNVNIDQLLGQMRVMEALAKAQPPAAGNGPESTDFSTVLKGAIDKVNDAQQQAGKLAAAFEVGDPQVDMTEVMLALQKASLSFQAMTQVRNRLVSAYQDVMSMPI